MLGLHGWRDNSGTFDRIVPLLPPSFYFVAIDVQGHGFSSHLPPGMPYHLMVRKSDITVSCSPKIIMIIYLGV